MKIQNVAFAYMAVLAAGAVLGSAFPSESAEFVDLVLPTTIDLRSQPFIRYRMTLFILASGLFLILFPVICYFGLKGMNSDQMKRVHWRHFAVVAIASPAGWIGFPFIVLCPHCWTANDYFYFFVTVFFFVALHISAQAIVLRLFRFERKPHEHHWH